MQDASGILDVAIGLVFIYLLLSLICSALTEAVEGFLKQRGKTLARGLLELFGGDGQNVEFLRTFYKNPLIYGLYKGDLNITTKTKADNTQQAAVQQTTTQQVAAQPNVKLKVKGSSPSYIPPKTFALALVNQILDGKPIDTANLKASIDDTNLTTNLKEALKTLVGAAGNDLNLALKNIEDWYSDMGERASGWYKRYAQLVAFAIAFFITVGGNFDTFSIAKSLMVDDKLRDSMVKAADQYSKANLPLIVNNLEVKAANTDKNIEELSKSIEELNKEISELKPEQEEEIKKKKEALEDKQTERASKQAEAEATTEELKICNNDPANCYQVQMDQLSKLSSLGLPIGWNTGDTRTQFPYSPNTSSPLEKLFGLFITAIAVSLGAPFWFDVLNKFMNFRATLKPKSEEGQANKNAPGAG